MLELQQRFLDFVLECLEGGEIVQMRAPFLDLFPPLLDGIVIGRIAGQVEHLCCSKNACIVALV
jgi:hypothetical protein